MTDFLKTIFFQNNNLQNNIKCLKNEALVDKIFIISNYNNKHYNNLINVFNFLNINFETYFLDDYKNINSSIEYLKSKIDFKTSLIFGLGDDTISYVTKKLSGYFETNYVLFLSSINSVQCFENFILEKVNNEIQVTTISPALKIFIEEDDITSLNKTSIKSLLKDLISHLDCIINDYFLSSLLNIDLNLTKIEETIQAYKNIIKIKDKLFFGEAKAKLEFFDNLLDICDYFNKNNFNYVKSNNFNYSKSLYFLVSKENSENVNFYDICATSNMFLFDMYKNFWSRNYNENFDLPNLYKTSELCKSYKLNLNLTEKDIFLSDKQLNFKLNSIRKDCLSFLNIITDIHNEMYDLFKKFSSDGGYKLSKSISYENLINAFILTPYFCKEKNILNLLYWIGALNF